MSKKLHASLLGSPFGLISPVHEEYEESAQMNTITGASLPVSHLGASRAIFPSRFILPTSGDITAEPVGELSPAGIPEAARRPIMASRPTLVLVGHSGISQAEW